LHSISLELFRKKNIVIQGQTAIPEASSPGKMQIRPHHFYHTGPFVTSGGEPGLNKLEWDTGGGIQD